MRRALLTTCVVAALPHGALAAPPRGYSLADAFGPVAAPPVAEAEPEPVVGKPSSAEIDLSSLGLDPTAAAFDDKLTIYGFADVGWSALHWSRDPVITSQDTRSFVIGNLNLYLAKNLTPRARALAEVRFTFLPNGSQSADGSYVNTMAQDITNFARATQWGGIVIERAYVEYDLTDHLTIRAGHWLTPYGVWNIDHGSPVILGTFRPYIIGEQFFPEHQTGLDLFGSHDEQGFKIGGHLTASNGRGATEAQADQDNHLAFGARLELETPWGLKLGGSYYRGRYTGLPTSPGVPAQTYLEAAYGADVVYDRGPLHVQGEIIARDRHYKGTSAAALQASASPDPREFGYYGLVGYRFDRFWNVMPFLSYESYEPSDTTLYSRVAGEYLGLNFRPAPSLVLKLQGTRALFADGLFADETTYVVTTQASWVF